MRKVIEKQPASSGDVNDVVKERGGRYGDFRNQGQLAQDLKDRMREHENWSKLPGYIREGLDMVQHKISRLINGDYTYDDNFIDIQGYAEIMKVRASEDAKEGEQK